MPRTLITLTCTECGVDFAVRPYRAATARFCSKSCTGTWHGRRTWRGRLQPFVMGNQLRKGLRPANSFEPGHATWNKGMAGLHLSPQSEFQPGLIPLNKLALGSVTVRTHRDDYPRAWIKVGEPSEWQLRARVVWESEHGPIPEGMLIHHEDRDTLNDDLTNLRCLTRAEHLLEHEHDLRDGKLLAG